MAGTFEVELITPAEVVFSGVAERLSAPGVAGSLGILANHAPLLTELKFGEATLLEAGGAERTFYIGGGFLEVNKNHVTILAEDAAAEGTMDPAEADQLLRLAQERLQAAAEGQEAARAQIDVARAQARANFVRRR